MDPSNDVLTVPQPATSLGGVESLIERRLHSDPGADPKLIRVSVGVEELEVSSSYGYRRDISAYGFVGPQKRFATGAAEAGQGMHIDPCSCVDGLLTLRCSSLPSSKTL